MSSFLTVDPADVKMEAVVDPVAATFGGLASIILLILSCWILGKLLALVLSRFRRPGNRSGSGSSLPTCSQLSPSSRTPSEPSLL